MRATPLLSHCKTGVPVTPLGREREQVRVTVAKAMTIDEGEEVSEMLAGTVDMRQWTEFRLAQTIQSRNTNKSTDSAH